MQAVEVFKTKDHQPFIAECGGCQKKCKVYSPLSLMSFVHSHVEAGCGEVFLSVVKIDLIGS